MKYLIALIALTILAPLSWAQNCDHRAKVALVFVTFKSPCKCGPGCTCDPCQCNNVKMTRTSGPQLDVTEVEITNPTRQQMRQVSRIQPRVQTQQPRVQTQRTQPRVQACVNGR